MVMRCPIQLVHPFVVLSYLLALHKVILRTELPFYMTIMATIMGHGVLNVAIKFIVVAFFHRWNTLLPTLLVLAYWYAAVPNSWQRNS